MATPKVVGGYTRPTNSFVPAPTQSPIQSVFGSAVNQQADDYDKIFQGYESLANRANPFKPTSHTALTPTFSNYIQGRGYESSPELQGQIENLSGFSETGGFSEGDIGNIRARGVAPIRSAYANALRNLNRQKSLQGGYSPGHGAALAKFAREQGGLMSDKMTDINASIAESVNRNKLSASSMLAPLLARENENRNQFSANETAEQRRIEQHNQDLINEFNRFNEENRLNVERFNSQGEAQANDDRLQALQGMTSIYGTTPALVNTFGQQALQDRNQTIQSSGQAANTGLNLISQLNKPRSSGYGGVTRRIGL